MDIEQAQKAILEVLSSITPRSSNGGLEYSLLADKEKH
jgi:hypothetical protein